MKKLRFVSVIIILLLFCPFIKQCDGMKRKATNEIELNRNLIIDEVETNSKINYLQELKTYFTEDSENVFEIACENGKSIIEGVIIEKKSIINDKSFIIVFSFCLLSISLIISSLLTLIYSFS